ncbi:MAG: NADPH:quinone oxidoreductase family protein [Bacteroidota bacterium]
MRAILVQQLAGPEALVLADHQLEKPGADRLLIDVKYAGVNFADVLITKGKYQFQPELPFSPGGEVAGIVLKVGSAVQNFKPGERVVAGTTWGGFAEEALGFAFNAHHLPDDVSFKDAAAVLMTHGTVLHALKDRAQLSIGERLVILGASGGVGTAAIQLGNLLGAEVHAFTSSVEKSQYCKQAGADQVYVYSEESLKNQIKSATGGKGADVIFDPIGGAYSEQAFRGIAPGGRHLVIGFASGEVPKIPWNLPLLKSASIVGAFWGSFFRHYPEKNRKNVAQLLQWLQDGTLVPLVDQTYPLSETAMALQRLEDRQVKGKILIKVA